MKDQGMGGFFIHSREGLETQYLSDSWMEAVAASTEEASKQGLEVWMYDEDKWPSGSVGGMVSAANPKEFSAKALSAEVETAHCPEELSKLLTTLHADPTLLQVYLVSRTQTNGDALLSFSRWEEREKIARELEYPVHLMICRVELSGPSEWYNNLAPSDMMNPEAVACFINLTHERYKNQFTEKLGTEIAGFFTDEPNVCDFFTTISDGRPWLPWSTHFSEYFEASRGYSVLKILPLLFFHGEGEEEARYDYWLTVTQSFLNSYTKQLYHWCENAKVKLTGHMLYENDLGYMVRTSGAVMPHYQYMHVPGIDLLGDQRKEYLTVKQCTSVANQLGKQEVLSETYGCTGWDFSFSGQKRVGDWQYVMGVTRRCQHLALYSLTGCRKRDYPPSFNYQSTWWEHIHVMEDYFARLSVCTSTGTVQRDILVLHPIGSFWMQSGSSMEENLQHIEMNMGWLDPHILGLNKEGVNYKQ